MDMWVIQKSHLGQKSVEAATLPQNLTRLAQGRTGLTMTLVAVTYAAQPTLLRELLDEYR
jgi:hypothetical protein